MICLPNLTLNWETSEHPCTLQLQAVCMARNGCYSMDTTDTKFELHSRYCYNRQHCLLPAATYNEWIG